MPEFKEGLLSKYDIAVLRKNGVKLDDDNRMFYGMFLFNDKLNEATDPMPFQIHTDSLDKIAKTFIGRPHVVRPEDISDESKQKEEIKNNIGEHVRGEIDDPAKIIEFQKKYAIGDMITYYKTPSNNVYGIYAAYPEYEDLIEKRQIPRGTSPLLEPRKMEGNIVYDAIGLHVQSVGATGYEPHLAKITGTCTGMLDGCTSMLRTMGASKQLYDFRRNLLNSTKQHGNLSMPEKTIQDLEAEIKTLNTKLGDAESKIKTLGAKGEQILEIPKEITDKLQKYDAIEKQYNETKTEFDSLKKEREEEKAEAAKQERLTFAEIIANGEIITKEYPEDKKAERVKFWSELKDTKSGELKDISLLAEKFQKMTPKSIGSSGLRLEDVFPQMGGNDTQISTFDIMEDIS